VNGPSIVVIGAFIMLMSGPAASRFSWWTRQVKRAEDGRVLTPPDSARAQRKWIVYTNLVLGGMIAAAGVVISIVQLLD
jgi:hypothetical protein